MVMDLAMRAGCVAAELGAASAAVNAKSESAYRRVIGGEFIRSAGSQAEAPVRLQTCVGGGIGMSKLLVENYQLGLGAEQFRDTDGIAPNHLRRDLSRIIAGTEYDDLGAWDLAQPPFEIAVCRHQDEVVSGGVVQKCCGRRRGRARFEARFRTQGRMFLTTQPEVRTKRQPGGAVSLGLKRSIHGLDYSEEFAVLEGGRELS